MQPCAILSACAIALLSACASTPPAGQFPTLKSRLAPEWKAGAEVVEAGRFTVWYHGMAVAGPTARPGHWNGLVTGDILAKSPRGYVVIPEGTFKIDPQNHIGITGLHRTVLF